MFKNLQRTQQVALENLLRRQQPEMQFKVFMFIKCLVLDKLGSSAHCLAETLGHIPRASHNPDGEQRWEFLKRLGFIRHN